MAILSHRDAFESQGGYRDRGRAGRRDRGPGRQRSSRSRSPVDKSSKQQFRRNSQTTATHLSACPVCLSHKKHPIRQCQATTLWDGQQKTRCRRTEDGRIVDNTDRTLCSNWNQSIGCDDQSGRHIHECSGCGKMSHGAQNCSLAEKTSPANSSRR